MGTTTTTTATTAIHGMCSNCWMDILIGHSSPIIIFYILLCFFKERNRILEYQKKSRPKIFLEYQKKNTRLENLKCFDVYEIVCTLALFVSVIFLKNPSESLKTSEEKCVLAFNLPNILQNYFDIYVKYLENLSTYCYNDHPVKKNTPSLIWLPVRCNIL